MQVEIVLTAHPTEAKRATVLEHHRRLYRLLAQGDVRRRTAAERDVDPRGDQGVADADLAYG
jgi:phosphoenolpyruvate carboxylase